MNLGFLRRRKEVNELEQENALLSQLLKNALDDIEALEKVHQEEKTVIAATLQLREIQRQLDAIVRKLNG